MSDWRRREEKRKLFEAEQEIAARERARLEARPLWQKIDEATTIGDVKEILRSLVEKLQLE